MKRLSIALVTGVALIAFSPGLASAKPQYNTNVTIIFEPTYSPAVFHGLVKSNKKAACRKNRTVKVKRDEGSENVLYGTGISDQDGNWFANGQTPTPSGLYFAKVKQKKLNNGALCKSGKSDTILVDP